MTYSEEAPIVWDPVKSRANRQKHGVTFEAASELFISGVDYLEIFDEAHSELEDRFLAIGPIAGGLFLVVWTETEEDMIRIISARWASQRERRLYEAKVGGRG